MNFSKNIFKLLICILAVSIISMIAVYAVMPLNTNNKEKSIETSGKLNNPNKIDSSTYEAWKESIQRLSESKNTELLSKDKLNQLYDKGYSLNDIENAERLSILSGKDVEEILNLKYSKKDNTLIKSTKTWKEIEASLDIDVNDTFDKLKIPKDKVSSMKSNHFSDDQIIQAGILALNYSKDFDKIINDFKSGKTYDELDKLYWEERNSELNNKDQDIASIQKELENRIKKDISEDEMQLSKQYGVNQIIEICYAKNLVEKYKTTLKHVLELKKRDKNWATVINTLKEEMK